MVDPLIVWATVAFCLRPVVAGGIAAFTFLGGCALLNRYKQGQCTVKTSWVALMPLAVIISILGAVTTVVYVLAEVFIFDLF
jgi:hypothetical protein